jgi:hypothetical protein
MFQAFDFEKTTFQFAIINNLKRFLFDNSRLKIGGKNLHKD